MEFKVGDKVKLIKDGRRTLGFEEGDICEITNIDCMPAEPIQIKKYFLMEEIIMDMYILNKLQR